jgi:transcriptional regulator with XRE-family HTH domain
MSERGFFADRLKALRDQAGLSQAGLAERSGVGVSTIRQFEYGWREPTYGTLVKLAQGLGVSLGAFDTARVNARRSAEHLGPSPRPAKARQPQKQKGK